MVTLYHGRASGVAAELEPGSVRTIVTSPPYFNLRDYGSDDQIGAESTVGEYVERLVGVFAALRRVLADDGTLWLNLGDSYATDAGEGRGKNSAFASRAVESHQRRGISKITPGLHRKNLLGVPWRVAFALQADGWILRSDVIWGKPNAMPESVTDRPTKAHEYLFLLAKSPRYYYDADAIAQPVSAASVKRTASGKPVTYGGDERGDGSPQDKFRTRGGGEYRLAETVNRRTVWWVPTVPFKHAHFATYPPELIRPCILAGSPRGGVVLDPFSGSGTTGMVAIQEGRRYVGIDINADYLDLSLRTRFRSPVLDLTGGAS